MLNEAIDNAKMVESSMKIDDDKSVSIVEPSISDNHLANINSQINTLTTKINSMTTSNNNNNNNHNSNYNNYSHNNYDANQSRRPPIKCYYCNKRGHLTRDCRMKAADEGRQRTDYQRTPSQERKRPPYRGLSPGRNAYPEQNSYPDQRNNNYQCPNS